MTRRVMLTSRPTKEQLEECERLVGTIESRGFELVRLPFIYNGPYRFQVQRDYAIAASYEISSTPLGDADSPIEAHLCMLRHFCKAIERLPTTPTSGDGQPHA